MSGHIWGGDQPGQNPPRKQPLIVPVEVWEPMTRKPMVPKAVRVPDELWRAAQAKADERGEYLSEVIRRALERYVKRS